MGHEWEHQEQAEVHATPEQVWEAIATGPGIDSWFMGRTQVTPGEGGAVHTDLGGFVMGSTITGWEPSRRFAYSGEPGPDGRFVAYEYLIEGRDQGSAVLRLVANGFLPGDDWETEFDAMLKGGQMYFQTLLAYLTHFAGRTGTPVSAAGPIVADWPRAWQILREELGLSDTPAIGDQTRLVVDGLPPVDTVVDFINPHALGLRGPDGLYRFIRGFHGPMVVGHHLFATPASADQVSAAWRGWLGRLYG
ncbi:MAG TPA: SRPBCC domain-containing protein [Micromonosporaceae bacterium]